MLPETIELLLTMIESDPFIIRLIMDEMRESVDKNGAVHLDHASRILQAHGMFDAFVEAWKRMPRGLPSDASFST